MGSAAAVKMRSSRVATKKAATKHTTGVKPKAKVVALFNGKRKAPKSNQTKVVRELSVAQREQLVLKYRLKARKLGRSIMRKWQSRIDINELDSIVDLSLCEAAKRFNPTMGASFITFLFYHLRGNLIRAVSDAVAQSSVPVAEFDAFMRAEAGETSNSQFAVSAIEVASALCNFDPVLPDEQLYKKEVARISQGACERLDHLEREIIERIYLHEEQLMDIASSLGYSRCHISRVKRKALEALYEDLSVTLDRKNDGAKPGFQEEIDTPRRNEARSLPRKLTVRRRMVNVKDNVFEADFTAAA